MLDTNKTIQENARENADTFEYLFNLQNSGRTNMFGAAQYMVKDLMFKPNVAKEYLIYWMQNCEEIAKELDIEF
tara:strand:+ start:282 stop:503 length:222 start_codon:yes stop_codon:yes gene_type:complete